MQVTEVQYLGREDPLEQEMVTHSSTLPWRSHDRRSMVSYSSQGRKKQGTTEGLQSLSLATIYFLHLYNFVISRTEK